MSVVLGSTASAFQAGSYSAATVTKAGAEFVLYDGGVSVPSIWGMVVSDAGVDGGFTLDLTSTGAEITFDGGVAWPTPHGTVTLTLNPSTGSTAQVTGTATF
jgi:hypothetical protein